ncbi:von Willebrand factor type A domain protein [Enhygromyxa salina]|uniref:von Willebrand factor type A domain protein n=1 Tax=Enhygromyxa salina TaxID=215803 RepID=A0A2S9YGN6_9BACT|nr:VWA domain-containing protein [Enhygromyxa salina]PRQ04275.1 von Willebrand factor type A domain protein [Enhygromyxa salina]
MRIAIVGALAALGMSLTSAAVWKYTDPDKLDAASTVSSDAPDSPREGPKVDDDDPEPAKLVDKSTFVAGETLMVEGRLGQSKMLADTRGETLLFVDVRNEPDPLDPLGARTSFAPLNLAIVIDHSGSMKGQRERNAHDAAAGMIRRLRDGDTVSVVSYSEQARIVVPVTTISTVTRERLIRDMLDGVGTRPSGNTCISCGVDLGMRTLAGRRAGIDRMLLLSDGEANRGVRDEAGMRVLARQARNRGATISSIGVDVDYNERLMSAIAREANGRHYFSETGANLEQIFDQELESLVSAVAKDTELVVELAPGVRVAEVLDRSYQQVDRRVIVPMGTFGAGEDKTFLMRLEVPPSPVGERPIANVTLSYEDLAGAEPGECFGELATQMTAAAAEVSPLDAIVLSRLTRSETAKTLERANSLFAQGRTAEAQAAVDEHLEQIRSRRKTAGALVKAKEFFDPFGRDLDDDFAEQAGVLDKANAGFGEAAAAPEPAAASRPGKAQVRRNAEAADAFAL